MPPLKTVLGLGFGFFVALLSPALAQTVALPYQLVVKPIFVQNGVGGNIAVQSNYAASFALFQEATQRVYAQAGIRVVWQTPSTFVSSSYYTVSNGTDVDNLVQTVGNGGIFDNHTLNVWFTGPNGGTLGVSQQSIDVTSFIFPTTVTYYGATVSESVFNPSSFYSLTALPHEIGHVLGIDHNIVNAGPSYGSTALTGGNLMTGGSLGATTLSQITTDGSTGFGILTANQIAMLRLNPMIQTNSVGGDTYNYSAIPEPSTFAFVAAITVGLCGGGYRLKKRKANELKMPIVTSRC